MSERRYYGADGYYRHWEPYLESASLCSTLRFVYKEKDTFFRGRIIKKWVDGMYFYTEITDNQAILHEFFSGDPVGACPVNTLGCSSPGGRRRIHLSNNSQHSAMLPYLEVREMSAAEIMDAVKPYMKDRELIASEFRRKRAQKNYEDSCKAAKKAAEEAAKAQRELEAVSFLDDMIGH